MTEAKKYVWLITGTSSGFGREIALAALARGDTVVATARNPSKIIDLASKGAITEQLDVTSPDETLANTIARILAKTNNRIDILVNNAGYILQGPIEECNRDEIHALFSTNVYGQFNLLRAVLPVMRRQRSGVMANMGSVNRWYTFPSAGFYSATKAAVTLFSDTLRLEVAHLGIKVVSLEPGFFRTKLVVPGEGLVRRQGEPIENYKVWTETMMNGTPEMSGKQPGDPVKGARLIVEALTGTGRCEGREVPTRLSLGSDAYGIVGAALEMEKKVLDEWKDLSITTDAD